MAFVGVVDNASRLRPDGLVSRGRRPRPRFALDQLLMTFFRLRQIGFNILTDFVRGTSTKLHPATGACISRGTFNANKHSGVLQPHTQNASSFLNHD
jgi:hypothetical protein